MKHTKNLELIPTRFPSVFNIQLSLEHETRWIAKIDLAGEGTLITQRKPKHIFKKTNSLGINHQLLTDESILFRWIVIEIGGRKLVTSRLYFLTHGKCFKFSNQGFELQCFLPVAEFGIERAEKYEKSIGKQFSLFQEVA